MSDAGSSPAALATGASSNPAFSTKLITMKELFRFICMIVFCFTWPLWIVVWFIIDNLVETTPVENTIMWILYDE